MKPSAPIAVHKDSDSFQLVESHRPYLESGNYVIEVDHVLETGKGGETFKAKPLNLYVFGDRFTLPAGIVKSMYPPDGSRGVYDHALPQILLNRSSLPWERAPLHQGEDDRVSPSWLAVLVFSEEEAKRIDSHFVPLSEPNKKGETLDDGTSQFGFGLRTEPGQHASDQVHVIDLPWHLLDELLPRYNDLQGLAHVRRVSEGNPDDTLSIRPAEGRDDATDLESHPAKAISPELAVVVANRLPPRDTKCVAYLVSLEERYRPAERNSDDIARRNPIEVSSPDLIGWLKQAHDMREHEQALSCDLLLRAGQMARLRVVDDRDKPDKNPATIVENPDMLGGDETDAYCLELLGVDPLWRSQLEKAGRVRVVNPLVSRGNVLGLFEVTVFNQGWKARDIEDADFEFFKNNLFSPPPEHDMDVVFLGQSSPPAGAGEEVNAWIGDAAIVKATAQLTQALSDLPSLPQRHISTDLVDLCHHRDELKTEIKAQIKTAKGNTKQLLEKHATRLAGIRLSVKVDLYGVQYNARFGFKGARLTASLGRRDPRYAAQVRALRNEPVFMADGLGGDDTVRLVTLANWSFYNEGEDRSFTRELLDLNSEEVQLKNRDTATRFKETSGGFHLPIPEIPKETTEEDRKIMEAGQSYLQAGSVGLPHSTRSGETTLSWYRGPFVPTAFKPPNLPLPALGPDALMVYDADLGMFDVSYAAAWEMGRLTTLKDNDFAMTLFHWKRDHARTLAHLRQKVDHDFLPLIREAGPSAPPEKLTKGFERLTLLESVPFNYLVPDELMLPVDSVRFFDVDPLWLEALRDGAFSVGRVLAKDHLDDVVTKEEMPQPAQLSGMLLRSSVVSDWADLRVNGYTAIDRARVDLSEHPEYEPDGLTLERFAHLGRNVLLCLFSDPKRLGRSVEMVDIHLPAEVLHCGLEVSANDTEDDPPPLIKRLHNPSNGLPLHALRSTGTKDAPDGMVTAFQIDASTDRLLKVLGAAGADRARVDSLRSKVFETREVLKQALDDLGLDILGIASFLAENLRPKVIEEQMINEIPFRANRANNVLDVTRLMDEVANRVGPAYPRGHRFSGADFALQMLDFPPLVRFVRPENQDSEAAHDH